MRAPRGAARWRASPRSVVAIEIDQTRAFDTEWNSSAQATGFVVDAERGLILTNRHVVTPGPVTSEATFLNREEVQLYPVYRDPIHDFGIYRYDPKKLRFIKPRSLPLYPDGAQIGREIRVIGNNAGEQLSILAGTHRQARPRRARIRHRQVQRLQHLLSAGRVRHLGWLLGFAGHRHPGPRRRAQRRRRDRRRVQLLSTARPREARARSHQAGKAVPRGALQVVFHYTPYDELRRLGLTEKTEESARKAFPALTGMLVVNEVLPGGPGRRHAAARRRAGARERQAGVGVRAARAGDRRQRSAAPWTSSSSAAASRSPPSSTSATCTTSRRRPTSSSVTPWCTPSLTSMARHFNVAVSGVYVANPGYIFGAAGVPRGAVISSANGKPTPNLAAFEAVVAGLADGERFTVRYSTVDDPNGSSVRSARMDRRWFPANHCLRDDAAGLWQCAPLPGAGLGKARSGRQHALLQARRSARRGARALRWSAWDSTCRIRSPASPSATIAAPASWSTRRAVSSWSIATPCPVSMGDVRIAFAGTLEIPGKVEFVHPLHNLAIVSYDPKLIGNTPVTQRQVVRPQDHRRARRCGWSAWARTASSMRAPRRSRRCRPSSCRCRAPCSSARAISRPSSS